MRTPRENAMIDWQMKFGTLMIVDVLMPSVPCNLALRQLTEKLENDDVWLNISFYVVCSQGIKKVRFIVNVCMRYLLQH